MDDTLTSPTGVGSLSPSNEIRRSIAAYLVLMLYLVGIKLALAVMAGSPGFRSPAQTAVFAWPAIAIITVVGSIGVLLLHRLGLPGVWSRAIPLSKRLALPALAGLAMGCLAIGIDLLSGWSALSAKTMGLPSIHIAWPSSLLIYPGGAIIVNVIYYLVPIPLLLWLVTTVSRGQVSVGRGYWAVAVLASLVEPVTQAMGNGLSGSAAVAAVFMAQDFAANLAQAYAFRHAGFGASVVFRVGFYLVWHVLYGLTGA